MDGHSERRRRRSHSDDLGLDRSKSARRKYDSRKDRDRSLSSEAEERDRDRDRDRDRRRRDRSADRRPERRDDVSQDEADRRRRRSDYRDRKERRRDRDRRDASEDDDDDDVDSSRRTKRHERRKDISQSPKRSHRQRRSRSPPTKRRRDRSDSPPRKSRAPLPSQDESFQKELPPGERPAEKQKPNFKPTGLLAKEANTVAGTTTVLKYHEPPEGRKPPPKEQWRMYIFKGKDMLDTIYLHQRSVWLMGRDPKVTDLLLEHPSISKQHAVIQFRHSTTTNEYGDRLSKVKPYLIDLESTKGSRLNGKQIEASRFVELVDQDVVSFGDSEREYVMMLPSANNNS